MQTMQVLLLIYFPLCEWRKLQCCSSSQLWLFTMWESFAKSSKIIWFQHQGQQPLNCVQETPQHTKKPNPKPSGFRSQLALGRGPAPPGSSGTPWEGDIFSGEPRCGRLESQQNTDDVCRLSRVPLRGVYIRMKSESGSVRSPHEKPSL